MMNNIEIICAIVGAAIAVGGVVLAGIKYLLDKASNKAVNEHRFNEVEKKVNDLSCDKHDRDIEHVNKLHSNLECVKSSEYSERVKKSIEISESNNEMLRVISAWVMKQDTGTIRELSKKFSPRRMTSLGEYVYAQTKAKEVLEMNMDLFIDELRKFNPTTAYDVENKALEVILPLLSKDIFIPIKSYLYNAPEYISHKDPETNKERKFMLSMNAVIFLMSLSLRDEYLKRYKSEIKG